MRSSPRPRIPCRRDFTRDAESPGFARSGRKNGSGRGRTSRFASPLISRPRSAWITPRGSTRARKFRIGADQRDFVGEDMRGLVEHDVAFFLGGLLALQISLDVALVRLQAIVGIVAGDRVAARLDRRAVLRILHDLLLRLAGGIDIGRRARALARLALGFFLVALLAPRGFIQRHDLLVAHRARIGDLGREVLPFGVRCDARAVALDQHRHDRLQIRDRPTR